MRQALSSKLCTKTQTNAQMICMTGLVCGKIKDAKHHNFTGVIKNNSLCTVENN